MAYWTYTLFEKLQKANSDMVYWKDRAKDWEASYIRVNNKYDYLHKQLHQTVQEVGKIK